jgi:hypothetical protein
MGSELDSREVEHLLDLRGEEFRHRVLGYLRISGETLTVACETKCWRLRDLWTIVG